MRLIANLVKFFWNLKLAIQISALNSETAINSVWLVYNHHCRLQGTGWIR
jgi:hypothetical protein